MMNLELLTPGRQKIQATLHFIISPLLMLTLLWKIISEKISSSYHVIDYDTATGKAIKKRNGTGRNDSSAWARGQAWALYGYTTMFRETKNRKYRSWAQHIAGYLLHHRNRPADDLRILGLLCSMVSQIPFVMHRRRQ